jgi:branched-chain amino acid aminotransferase
MKLSLNGQLIPQLTLQGDEPEFNYAYGVFETIRTYNGKPFELLGHLQRLRRSAESISLTIPQSNEQLTKWVQAHCASQQEQRIKLIAAPDKIYIISKPLEIDPKIYKRGVSVGLYTLKRSEPSVKSLARIHEYLAWQQAKSRDQHDAILINERKEVYECAQANFYYVKDDVIYTARHGILSGITRNVVLQLANQRYTVQQKRIYLDEVLRADECFLTQTSSGVVPVVKIEERPVGNGKPGMVTKDLMELFSDYVQNR